MRYELLVSLRYLFGRRKERFVAIISWISVLGIALGVMALIIVISVMSGFDRELRDRMVGFYADLTVTQSEGISNWQELMKQILSHPDVVSASPFIQGQAMATEKDQVVGIVIRGIDPIGEIRVTQLGKFLRQGEHLPVDGIWLGSELATKLGLWMGDKISLISPSDRQPHDYHVTGIFTSQMYEYDANVALLSLTAASQFLGVGDRVTGIGIKTRTLEIAPYVTEQLRHSLKRDYLVRSWMDLNQALFKALKLEKTVMFLILTMIVLVACFNISSTLIMMVMEKTKDIGILKAIGVGSAGIHRIFTIMGLWLGLLGTFLGLCGGLTICFLLKKYPIIRLPSDIYYIDRLPVDVGWNDITWIFSGAMVLVLLSTLYPASHAARLDPVSALRYE